MQFSRNGNIGPPSTVPFMFQGESVEAHGENSSRWQGSSSYHPTRQYVNSFGHGLYQSYMHSRDQNGHLRDQNAQQSYSHSRDSNAQQSYAHLRDSNAHLRDSNAQQSYAHLRDPESTQFTKYSGNRMPVPQYWCFFDVEATGPSLKENFVPCLGVAIVEIYYDRMTGRMQTPRLIRRKKWYMKPPDATRRWDEYTISHFWMKPKIRNFYEHLKEMLASNVPVEPAEAMSEFVDLCRQYSGRDMSATLLSDTSGFDFTWLYYYLSHYGPNNVTPTTIFGQYRPVRDVTSYFSGVCGALYSRFPHCKTMQKFGIDDKEWLEFARSVKCPPHNHDPENDAAHVALRSAWIIWKLENMAEDAKQKARDQGDWRNRNRFLSKSCSELTLEASSSLLSTTSSVFVPKNSNCSEEDQSSENSSESNGFSMDYGSLENK